MALFKSKRTAGLGAAVAASIVVAGAVAGLKPSEGLSLKPYTDIVGVRTWCYGETQGKAKSLYTKAECDALLAERVQKDYYAPLVRGISSFAYLPAPTQIATVELAYNIGVGATIKGSVGRLLSAGHIKEACEAFKLYNKGKVNGVLKEVRGLTLRRERESKQCMEGLK